MNEKQQTLKRKSVERRLEVEPIHEDMPPERDGTQEVLAILNSWDNEFQPYSSLEDGIKISFFTTVLKRLQWKKTPVDPVSNLDIEDKPIENPDERYKSLYSAGINIGGQEASYELSQFESGRVEINLRRFDPRRVIGSDRPVLLDGIPKNINTPKTEGPARVITMFGNYIDFPRTEAPASSA